MRNPETIECPIHTFVGLEDDWEVVTSEGSRPTTAAEYELCCKIDEMRIYGDNLLYILQRTAHSGNVSPEILERVRREWQAAR